MKNEPNKKRQFSWQRLAMSVARLLCAPLVLLYRMRRLTPTGEPYKGRLRGGAILAANHTSFQDPFLVGVAFWYRRVYFLVAEVVMRGKFLSWLLRGVGAIRIDRNAADIEAIRKSTATLRDGQLLTIFPQGGIQSNSGMEALKSGAVLIALQAGVPIVPMYICPKPHWYSRRTVILGKTVDPRAHIQKKFPTTTDIDRVTQLLLEEMNRCAMYDKQE